MKSTRPAMAQHSNFETTETYMVARKWARLPGLVHAFSTRHADRGDFFARFAPVLLHQVHSDHIHVIEHWGAGVPARTPADRAGARAASPALRSDATATRAGKAAQAPAPIAKLTGDAMITNRPGIALAIKTADCLPVLLFDPKRRAIGAAHAGWRGTVARIAGKTVGAMRAHFGSDPAEMLAVLGPSIQACCYEVGQEVINKFRSQFAYADDLFRTLSEENPADIYLPRQVMIDHQSLLRNLEPAQANLDLVEANRRQLLDAGLAASNITTGAPCTACHTDLLYSYRREGQAAGRMYALIALTCISHQASGAAA